MPLPLYPRTRRDFIRDGIGLAALSATVPSFLSRTAFALDGQASPRRDNRVLVVIQLSGGNDGLNTVIPYHDDAYRRLRPTIGIPDAEILKIHEDIGLHPGLKPLQSLYGDGNLAIVQGVGYPNPDRSHFRSMEIWHTAQPDEYASTGWIGKLFDHTCGNAGCSPTASISIGQTVPPPLVGELTSGIAFSDPDSLYRMTQVTKAASDTAAGTGDSQLDFLRRTALDATVSAKEVRDASKRTRSSTDYPRSGIGRDLHTVADLIAGDLDTRVYYVDHGGFDTHANQQATQQRLLEQLADALSAFTADLKARGQADRVVGMVFSEFGRRVKENGSRGTDHGQAAPLFLFGEPVKGGLHGSHPSLTTLDKGDLKYAIDFRRIYATLLADWLGTDAKAILGADFAPLPLLG